MLASQYQSIKIKHLWVYQVEPTQNNIYFDPRHSIEAPNGIHPILCMCTSPKALLQDIYILGVFSLHLLIQSATHFLHFMIDPIRSPLAVR
jgi:hypothetical protein